MKVKETTVRNTAMYLGWSGGFNLLDVLLGYIITGSLEDLMKWRKIR
jgi:hypothetical protein